MVKFIILGYSIVLITVFCALKQDNELQQSVARGAVVYADFCITCHQGNGQGVQGAFPPLAQSDFLLNKRVEDGIKAIKYGLKGEIVVNGVTYNGNMASQGLSDEEVADVMNYILNSWGNKGGKIVTVEEVTKIKR